MSIWEAIFFGLVQGLTEFLPISSTAHIVLAGYVTGFTFPGLSFEIYLHLASVLAVILYFHKDLLRITIGALSYLLHRQPGDTIAFRFALYIVIATGITGVLGLIIERSAGNAIKHPIVVASGLLATGLFLLIVDRLPSTTEGRREERMRWWDAVIVGLGQTIAVLPGVSRSGSTLITALLVGLERDTAVRYSFLLAIPVILGSTVLMIPHFQTGLVDQVGIGALSLSFLVSFAATWVGIVWLIQFLKRRRLFWFSIYLFLVSGTLFYIQLRHPGLIVFS